MGKKLFSLFSLVTLAGAIAFAQDIVPKHNDKGQFGYGPENTKEFTIKPQWDEARPFNDEGIAIVRKDKSFGLIDKSGKPIGKSMGYSLIAQFDGTDLLLVAEGGNRVEDAGKIKTRQTLSPYGFRGSLSYPINGAKWGLVRRDGTFQVTPEYQELSSQMDNGYMIFQIKGLFGIMDINGNIIFEPLYDAVTPINNQGLAAIRNKKTQKWSLISKDGKSIVNEGDNVSSFYQFRDNYWGSLNTVSADSLLKNTQLWYENDRLMPIMTFSSSWVNSNQPYIAAQKLLKQKKNTTKVFGIYDITGKEIIPFDAGITYCFVPSEGIAVAYRNNQCGFYNIDSKTFSPVENRIYLPFKKGLSLSYSNNNDDFYLVDKNGNRKSDRYDGIIPVGEQYIVKKGNNQGLISLTGKEIIPVECMEVRDANNGLFVVRDFSGAVGYVDSEGNTVIPFDYSDGSSYVNNIAIVSKKVPGTFKKSYGIINRNNEEIVPIKYEKTVAGFDQNGNLCVWVKDNGVFYEYNLNKKTLTPTNYSDMDVAPFGTIIKNNVGTYGLIVNNKEVIPCSLEDADAVGNIWYFMLSNNIPTVTASEARSLSIKQNPDRNKFKLGEKIAPAYWDF